MKIDQDTEIRCIVNAGKRVLSDLEDCFGWKGFTPKMEREVKEMKSSFESFKMLWAEERERRGNL